MAKSIINKLSVNKKEFDSILQENSDWKTEMSSSGVNYADDFPGLVNKIYEGYVAEDNSKNDKKKTFAPSKLVWNEGYCPRYWYLAFSGAWFDNKFSDEDWHRKAHMDNGTDRHKRIQDALVGSGLLESSEFDAINEDPPIFGKVDGLINWEDSSYIVEIKTKKGEDFDKIRQNKRPNKGHIVQLLIYMKIFKRKTGILLYENKNSHDLIAIRIDVNDKHVVFMDYFWEWMREVYDAYKNSTIPKVPYRSNKIKKPCGECSLKQACWDAPEGEIKILRRKAEKDFF